MLTFLKRRRLAIAAVGILALLSACGNGEATGGDGNAGGSFVIGAVLPMTGPYGTIGPEAVAGFQIAIDEINGRGGILGRKVSLTVKDSASDVTKGVQAAQALLDSSPKPDMIIPDAISATAQGILALTTPAKVLTITQATLAELGDGTKYPYNYQLVFSTQQMDTAILGALKSKGVTKVGTMSSNDAAGVAFAAYVKDHAAAAGLQFVGSQLFTAGTADVSVLAQKLKSAGADGVAVHAVGPDNGTIMKAIQSVGWTAVPVIGDSSSVTGDLSKEIPAAVASQFQALTGAATLREGATASSPFITALAKKSNGVIGSVLISAIDNDMIETIAWAYNKAGATDSTKATAVLNKLADSSTMPADVGPHLVMNINPRWSAKVHSLDNADLSAFWGLANVSQLVNGTYQGEKISVPADKGLGS